MVRDTGEDQVGTGKGKDQLRAVQAELGRSWDILEDRVESRALSIGFKVLSWPLGA